MPDLPDAEAGRRRFRTNLIRVMSVQVISLIALWLVQRHFTP
ncbi:MAG: hypothetical protein ABIY52_11255 [Gemmatimonadaceae bacterium]